ncbi:SDR family NAD(P)-dependent oxidoreductase [Aquabacterium sp. OR-4]|uniref:SDR family NAD(P)-dependent oxidoreductase n=1 Tax=Aquabacterium sp. OR-4 TaxID=2978127 RepID=UPI0028C8E88D|nr:SDR family oxidoreductase [Aquabacterium sp. OR-4]MDT7839065.1 SDR family oxidoreductase [Aquabacterium sp. OR-4]
MLLQDKVCVITGAASLRSIGYATAELFAEHGAKVVVVDVLMDEPVLAGIRTAIETRLQRRVTLHGLQCDISQPEACEAMVREVRALHGTVDCLVNSAGIVRSLPLLEISPQELDRMLDVNLKGTFYLCQSVLKVFVEQRAGTIVNVASLAAQRGGGLVGGPHYAASKGGVLSLTRSIAREFGALGIRANAICPAMIDTPMLDGLSPERLQGIVDSILLKRIGSTRELAGACLFLASELSGFVTGATIDVNGGTHIH